MPSISTRGDGVQTTFFLPSHSGDVTATVNAVPVTITSQDALRLTLAAAPASGSTLVITYSTNNYSDAVLTKDSSGVSVQALAPSGTVNASISVSSARAVLPTGSQIVRVASNAKCFIKFGDANVVSTGSDMMFPLGAELFVVPVGATHIAAVQDGPVTGSLNITKMI